MARFFIRYWSSHSKTNQNKVGDRIRFTASNDYKKVDPGDSIYFVSWIKGKFHICGKLVVKFIRDKNGAEECLGPMVGEWKDFAIAEASTRLCFNLEVPIETTERFTFENGATLKFDKNGKLDKQTLRGGVRQISHESAAKLDALLEGAGIDCLAITQQTEEGIPEEALVDQEHYEGGTRLVTLNRHERNRKARNECIMHYGVKCFVCAFDFKSEYGHAGEGFIHVHHLEPVSSRRGKYRLDPIEDLRPVCPNCHAMIHKRNPPYSLTEMRAMLVTK